jgi:hypothetical protein
MNTTQYTTQATKNKKLFVRGNKKMKQKYINAVEENLNSLSMGEYEIKNILETILKEQRNQLFAEYNVYNMNVDREKFKINNFMKLKTIAEIETEIKNYFSQFDKTSKIKELVNKVGLFSYGYNAPKSKKELMQDCTQLIEFKKGEIIFNIYWNKLGDYGRGVEYSLKDMGTIRNIETLFKLVNGVDLKINFYYGYKPFYMQPLSEWQETNGFKYKGYLNGKFKIQGDEKYLKPIKDLYKERYKSYDHIKIIES